MGRTYEALMEAERLRAAQDPAALARRAAEEREALRTEFRALQEEFAALAKRVETGPTIDTAAIDDLERQVAQLATEPRQQPEAAMHLVKDELERYAATLRSHSEEVAGIARRLDDLQESLAARLGSVEQAQSESERHLHERLDTLQSSLTEQEPWADEMQALRAQLAPLVEAHGRRRQVADGIERAQASADEAARRIAALDEAQEAGTAAVQQQVAALEADIEESLRAAGEAQAQSDRTLHGRLDALQSSLTEQKPWADEMQALRAQLAPLVQAHGRRQQVADGIERAQTSADEAARRIAALDEAQEARAAAMQQQAAALEADIESLRAAGEAQAESNRTLHGRLDALQSSVAEQKRLKDDLEALHAQMGPLVEAQARQQEMVNDLRRAQETADEAVRRTAAIDEAQEARTAAAQEQVAALEADIESLRSVLGALQNQVAPLVEAQAQQQEMVNDIRRAQETADESVRRAVTIDKGHSSGVAILQGQIAELLADQAKLDKLVERRFELLCGIIDAELEARVQQLREYADQRGRGGSARVGSGRPSQSAPADNLIQRASSADLIGKE